MKKNLFLIAIFAVLLTGCYIDQRAELGIPAPDNPNVINFVSASTKAAVAGIEVVQTGFVVYATKNDHAANDFFINGKYYRYHNGFWTWYNDQNTVDLPTNEIPVWPTTVGGFPMCFYGFSEDLHDLITASISGSTASFGGSIIVETEKSSQIDFLSAKTINITSKPTGGRAPMIFKHIMSKINLNVKPGEGVSTFVTYAAVHNVNKQGNYKVEIDLNDSDKVDTWSGQNTLEDFVYLKNTDTPDLIPVGDSDPNKSYSVDYRTDVDKAKKVNMFLLPQDVAAWDATHAFSGEGEYPATGALIAMQYRLEKSGGNLVGMTNIDQYPFEDLEAALYGTIDQDYKPTGDWSGDVNSVPEEGGLYIKVGFPVTVDWNICHGYTYNIEMGTPTYTGGIYLDDTYYDEDGNDTGLPIDKNNDGKIDDFDDIVVGELVNDGKIHFNVSVEDMTNTVQPIQ